MASLFFLKSVPVWASTVHYELTATRATVNLSGKRSVEFALQINGSIPAPTLEFTEGDDAEIRVLNQIPGEEVSVHWHGILLPPLMDGVPYVTTPPIASGESFTFRFKIRQAGTYWYHSHTNVQEQKGLYGAIVIHPRGSSLRVDRELVAVLSDWSDEDATQILKNLRKDGDYYLYKKGTMRSWLGAIQSGKLGTYLHNEWTRMGGMDLSDVGYDAFLINGKRESFLGDARPGEHVRIRIINAAASTYFRVRLGQAPMTVIAADGQDVEPIEAREILMGMAETYDILFRVPEGRSTELRVTAQDGTGAASAWIGTGGRVTAPVLPMPDQYASMDHSGGQSGEHTGHADHFDHSAHAGHDPAPAALDHSAHSGHEPAPAAPDHSGHGGHSRHSGHGAHAPVRAAARGVEVLTVDGLRSVQPSTFYSMAGGAKPAAAGSKLHDVRLVLGGDMSRYVWHLNGKAIHQERTIEIREGDLIRFTFENQTMMHHPMHLHGHFFRVLTEAGERSPLKHTVDVPPHATRVIEFKADEPGEWMLHCHNLYHLKTGMARVVQYAGVKPSPEVAHYRRHDPHLHDHGYWYGQLEAASNHAQARLRLSQTWNEVDARLETRNSRGTNFGFRQPWEFEGDLLLRRWSDRYLNWVVGGTSFDRRSSAVAGASYLLPMLIRAQALVDHRGKFRLDLEKRFQWTQVLLSDFELTWRPSQGVAIAEDLEFEFSLMFSPAWSWSAGLMLTNESLGGGIQIQF